MTDRYSSSHESDDFGFSLLAGLLLGGLAGALAGILYAPKSGSELREDLGALPKKLNDELTAPEGKARKLMTKTKLNLENKVEQVSDAIQARKMAKAKRLEDMASGYDFN
jgi:gas vesicle protein